MENHASRGWIFCTKGERVDVNRRNLCHRVLNTARRRLNQGNLNSFVLRRRDLTINFTLLSILWLGESKSPMTKTIVASNMSGGTRHSYSTRLGGPLTLHNSILWGTTKYAWHLDGGRSENGTKVRCSQIQRNCITERFHRPGVLLGRLRRRVADLEVDPREGRKRVHTFTAIIRSAWFGLPPSIWRGCDRAVLHSRSPHGVRERRFWYNSDRGHYYHHP